MESVCYTIEEVNAVAGCQVYTAAAMCDPCLLSVVQAVWSKAFVNRDVLFAAIKERFHRPGKAWVTSVLKCKIFSPVHVYSTKCT